MLTNPAPTPYYLLDGAKNPIPTHDKFAWLRWIKQKRNTHLLERKLNDSLHVQTTFPGTLDPTTGAPYFLTEVSHYSALIWSRHAETWEIAQIHFGQGCATRNSQAQRRKGAPGKKRRRKHK